MLNKIKIGWTRFVGVLDYFATPWMDSPARSGLLTLAFGAIGGVYGSAIWSSSVDGDMREAPVDELAEQVEFYTNGHLMQFPDNCGLEDSYILLSKDAEGKMQISKGDNWFSQLQTPDEQSRLIDDVDDCMDSLSKWAAKGNFDFADDFYYASNAKYASPFLVNDINAGEQRLHIDIIDRDVDDLEDIVEDRDDYNAEGDNTSLYQEEFAKAQQSWAAYKANAQSANVYFDKSGEIKNADKYPKYDHDSVTARDALGLFGYSFIAGFLLISGPLSTRWGTGYNRRVENRDEKINQLKSMSGRDRPIL